MSNGSGDGGMMFSPLVANGGLAVGGSGITIPMDGSLEEYGLRGEEFFVIKGAKFPESAWDPTLLAQAVLAEFSFVHNWKDHAKIGRWDDRWLNKEELQRDEIDWLLELREERAYRAAEISLQAENSELYWFNLLMLGPHGRPHTTSLIAIAMAVGHMVGMYWKRQFMRPRPVQIFPAIMPLIRTPSHPSYPSNHALQSHLIKEVMGLVLDRSDAKGAMMKSIELLASRTSENREIAGVHYASDTRASEELAPKVAEIMFELDTFQKILPLAEEEWNGLDGTLVAQRIGTQRRITKQIADEVAGRLLDEQRR